VGRERPIPAVVDGGGGARERGFYHQDGGGDVLSGGKKKLAVVIVPSNRNLSTGNSLLLLPLSPLSLSPVRSRARALSSCWACATRGPGTGFPDGGARRSRSPRRRRRRGRCGGRRRRPASREPPSTTAMRAPSRGWRRPTSAVFLFEVSEKIGIRVAGSGVSGLEKRRKMAAVGKGDARLPRGKRAEIVGGEKARQSQGGRERGLEGQLIALALLVEPFARPVAHHARGTHREAPHRAWRKGKVSKRNDAARGEMNWRRGL